MTRWAVPLALVIAGCSDDGLTPAPAAGSSGGDTGGVSAATSSVNTSATVTATGSGDGDEEAAETTSFGEGTTNGLPGDETGDVDTGMDTAEPTSSDDGGSTEGPEQECIATDDCVCDPLEVLCEAVPPVCPPGTVPQVDPAAMCWTFACVPAQSCQTVPDCTVCAEEQACVVRSDLTGLTFVCEPIPPECMDVPTCECMPTACPMPFECIDAPPKGGAELACTCELC